MTFDIIKQGLIALIIGVKYLTKAFNKYFKGLYETQLLIVEIPPTKHVGMCVDSI
jgi:hypothetical protein